jgi:hypothetical protein
MDNKFKKTIQESRNWKSEGDLYSTLGEPNFIGKKEFPRTDEDINSAEYFITQGMGLNGGYQ